MIFNLAIEAKISSMMVIFRSTVLCSESSVCGPPLYWLRQTDPERGEEQSRRNESVKVDSYHNHCILFQFISRTFEFQFLSDNVIFQSFCCPLILIFPDTPQHWPQFLSPRSSVGSKKTGGKLGKLC